MAWAYGAWLSVFSVPSAVVPERGSPEQPHDDQNEDDDEKHMNKITGLRNPWNSCGPKVPEKPQDDENDDEQFEHSVSFFLASARCRVCPF